MNSTKQYYNNTQPGETSIESRSGAKIVMDQNGGTTVISNLQDQNIDQLRNNNFNGNIAPNPDKNNSYLYIGKGNIDINNQGNTNQDSISLTISANSKDIIQPIPLANPTNLLPVYEPTPTPTPPVSEPVEEEEEEGVIIIEDLPENEDVQYNLFENTGVAEGGSGQETILTETEQKLLLTKINGFVYIFPSKNNKAGGTPPKAGGTPPTVGGTPPPIKTPLFTGGKITADGQVLLDSCKANNAVESAFRMNPTNYSTIVNDKLPKFQYSGPDSVMLNIIIGYTRCDPRSKYCAAGLSMAFVAANGNKAAGGFPVGVSSQLTFNNVPDVVIFKRDVDYNNSGLTDSGVALFKQTLGFKGAIYSVTQPNGINGHIGMILGAELIEKKGNTPAQAILYTIEYNTSDGVGKEKTTNAILAIRRRKIGGDWGWKGKDKRLGIAPTERYGGGTWAPNGIGKDNVYSFGSWITNKNIFK